MSEDILAKQHKRAMKKLNSEVEELADYIRTNTWPEDGEDDIYPAIVEFGKRRFIQGTLSDAEAAQPKTPDQTK